MNRNAPARVNSCSIVSYVGSYLRTGTEGRILAHQPCPFLEGTRCSSYEDRPTVCRSYPHLDRPDRVSRLLGLISSASTCPIAHDVLDALKAVCVAGADSVEIAVTKPPAAWKGIPYVEKLHLDLDHLDQAVTLFEGTAREGVPYFPANVNIAAALAMAGVGFDRTRLKVVADPALIYNTHYINIRGKTGAISIKFESVPFPDNPKTAMLACYSALAAFKQFNSAVRYGT